MTNYQTAVLAAAIITGTEGRWNYTETLKAVLVAMKEVPEGYKPPAPPLPPRVLRRG